MNYQMTVGMERALSTIRANPGIELAVIEHRLHRDYGYTRAAVLAVLSGLILIRRVVKSRATLGGLTYYPAEVTPCNP